MTAGLYVQAQSRPESQVGAADTARDGPITYPMVSSPRNEGSPQRVPYPQPSVIEHPVAADEQLELFFDAYSDVDRYIVLSVCLTV